MWNASTAADEPRRAEVSSPDVMAIDADLPEPLVAAATVADRWPSVEVGALSAAADDDSVVAWTEAGRNSFVSRDSSPGNFREAI